MFGELFSLLLWKCHDVAEEPGSIISVLIIQTQGLVLIRRILEISLDDGSRGLWGFGVALVLEELDRGSMAIFSAFLPASAA